MNLIEIPEEILMIIVSHLDLKSLANLYDTCHRLRSIVCLRGVIKVCKVSMNTLATARTLKLNFFKDISGHIKELSLKGVPDLYKTSLLTALKRLKFLKTLDVSYTNINIPDLQEIHEACPTINNITINFIIMEKFETINETIIKQYQCLFEHFENVHLVGCQNLFYSQLAEDLLENVKFNKLKFTLHKSHHTVTYENINKNSKRNEFNIKFSQFSIFMLNWKKNCEYYVYYSRSILSTLDVAKYEFIVIVSLSINNYKLYVSPLLKDFFNDNLHIQPEIITSFLDSTINVFGKNIAIMIWNRELTKFDETFYNHLYNNIKQFFPHHFCLTKNDARISVTSTNWYYTTPIFQKETKKLLNKPEPEFKKQRIAPSKHLLNFDEVLQDEKNVKLTLLFNPELRSPVTISSSCSYLKKLTFLNLTGFVRYSDEFFNTLFRCCVCLVTLNVEVSSISPSASAISRSLPLSRTVRNFRLVDKRIDFKTMFSSFTQCMTLENVCICDQSTENFTLPSLSLVFEKCVNLYSFVIHVSNEVAQRKISSALNKAKSKSLKPYINTAMYNNVHGNFDGFYYDPFIQVFNLSPINDLC